MSGEPNTSEQIRILKRDFDESQRITVEILHPLYDNLTYFLAVIGLIGGLVGLGTMFYNKYMQVTSYVYHKLVVVVTVLYCTNWLVVYYLDHKVAAQKGLPLFPSFFAAYYFGILQRVVSSSTGYIWQYASLLTAVDRFIALGFPGAYRVFSSRRTCWTLVTIIVLLSLSLHSWSPWLEKRVVRQNISGVLYYGPVPNKEAISPEVLRTKDYLNLAVRAVYPVLLTLFTVGAIGFYLKRSKKNPSQRSAWFRRQQRSLFLLMVGVVILAYFQVIPRETKRVLDMKYQKEDVMGALSNFSIPFKARLRDYHIWLYGIRNMQLITNICTVLDRALPFYLYFLLNPLFRRATLQFLCSCCLRQEGCAGRRPLQRLVSTGEGAEAEERKELLLLFSPQLVGNMKSVFNMTEMLCRGFIAMNYQKQSVDHAKLLAQRSKGGPEAFGNNSPRHEAEDDDHTALIHTEQTNQGHSIETFL